MERGESTRKREDRGEAMQHKKEGGGDIRRKAGESSNAKPAEFERRHWGNQKSSEPVCVVGACVRNHICCTLTSTILPKQSTK